MSKCRGGGAAPRASCQCFSSSNRSGDDERPEKKSQRKKLVSRLVSSAQDCPLISFFKIVAFGAPPVWSFKFIFPSTEGVDVSPRIFSTWCATVSSICYVSTWPLAPSVFWWEGYSYTAERKRETGISFFPPGIGDVPKKSKIEKATAVRWWWGLVQLPPQHNNITHTHVTDEKGWPRATALPPPFESVKTK